MLTIKQTIDNFCYRLNIPAQSSYAGSTGPAALQYLSLFEFIGNNLRNRPFNWPQLKRGYTFTTETDERRYQLPGDFYRLLNSTQWDTTNQWPMLGPISDANYTMREFAVVSQSTFKAYRLLGPTGYLYSTSPYSQRSAGSFQIDPPGENNTDELFLGYISSNWIWPRDWVASTVYAAGAIRSGDGYVYRTAAGGTSGATRPNWTTGSDTDGAVTWTVYTEPYVPNSSNSDLNDSDLCLFDDDLMIEGMRWAWFRAKKQGYEQELMDWENMVRGAVSRFNGPTRINICEENNGLWEQGFPRIPDGGWSV
jgi:hypothetical protein